MTTNDYIKSIKTAQEIYALVHANIYPSDDAGSLENLCKLIDDLNSLKESLLDEDQIVFDFVEQKNFKF